MVFWKCVWKDVKTFDLRKIRSFKDPELPQWERLQKKDPEKYTSSEIVLWKVALKDKKKKKNSRRKKIREVY